MQEWVCATPGGRLAGGGCRSGCWLHARLGRPTPGGTHQFPCGFCSCCGVAGAVVAAVAALPLLPGWLRLLKGIDQARSNPNSEGTSKKNLKKRTRCPPSQCKQFLLAPSDLSIPQSDLTASNLKAKWLQQQQLASGKKYLPGHSKHLTTASTKTLQKVRPRRAALLLIALAIGCNHFGDTELRR